MIKTIENRAKREKQAHKRYHILLLDCQFKYVARLVAVAINFQ
jgi:hypothetical protein